VPARNTQQASITFPAWGGGIGSHGRGEMLSQVGRARSCHRSTIEAYPGVDAFIGLMESPDATEWCGTPTVLSDTLGCEMPERTQRSKVWLEASKGCTLGVEGLRRYSAPRGTELSFVVSGTIGV